MNARKRTVRELQRHERLGRERTSQVAGVLSSEAKSRIVLFVPEYDDDALAPVAELSKPKTNHLAAHLTALMIWQNGHGRQ